MLENIKFPLLYLDKNICTFYKHKKLNLFDFSFRGFDLEKIILNISHLMCKGKPFNQ